MAVSAVEQARRDLLAALRTVDGLKVLGDPGGAVDPPTAVVGIPAVGWRAYSGAPTEARFVVVLVVPADDRATERLSNLLPPVVAAVETSMTSAALQDGPAAAQPAVWNSSGVELPAWEVIFNVDL